MAIKIVEEIKNVLNNEESDDIEMIEEIVSIYEKYGIDTGACHN